MSTPATRRFAEEIFSVIGRRVEVETSEGRLYQGDLIGADEKLNLVLDRVSSSSDKVFKVVLNGSFVKEIRLIEKPFDLKALSERLGKVFPGLVKLREDIGAVVVMDKFKVTEHGLVEGVGLAGERVKMVYEEFLRESKKATTK